MLQSFTPGAESVHTKNPNYWGEGLPYLDEVQIIDFADAAALVNALYVGRDRRRRRHPVRPGRAPSRRDSNLRLLESEAGSWLPITMAIDQPPFDDVRVRQAMRLILDREEMVERVLSGHGRVGNDMYGVFDPCYPDFPQREQDIDQAKALLAEAGQEDLTIDLFAPDDTAGLADLIAVFADQAKAAGVTVNAQVLDGATYWGDEYTKRTFATSFWGTRRTSTRSPQGSLKTATVPRDPLAAGGQRLRGQVQRRRWPRPTTTARCAHHRGDAAARSTTRAGTSSRSSTTYRRHGRQRAGARRPAERAQPRPLRPRLQEHLARGLTPRARRTESAWGSPSSSSGGCSSACSRCSSSRSSCSCSPRRWQDPARAILGRDATPEACSAKQQELGLDEPLVTQYWDWLTGLLTGDPGQVVHQRRPGAGRARRPHLELAVPDGGQRGDLDPAVDRHRRLRRARRDKTFDSASSGTTLVLASMPEFVRRPAAGRAVRHQRLARLPCRRRASARRATVVRPRRRWCCRC